MIPVADRFWPWLAEIFCLNSFTTPPTHTTQFERGGQHFPGLAVLNFTEIASQYLPSTFLSVKTGMCVL
jgi:hypothetical protein